MDLKQWKDKKKQIYIAGIVVCGILLCGVLVFMGISHKRQKDAEALYESLRAEEEAAKKEQEEPVAEEIPEVSPYIEFYKENTIDFDSLHETNEDIYAWIQIPGTKVDYPVLQHPTDDSYYLNRTVKRASGLPGSIYSESIHARDFSDPQTILYGHNMKNGTMFGSLHNYEKEENFQGYPYVYIYLPEKTLLYQIFAAVKFSDAYLPAYYDFEEEDCFTSFIEDVRESSGLINEELDVSFGDQILTMSTCISKDPTHRFLVVAVLVDEYENAEVIGGRDGSEAN
ncbi:MAG: class B sortase [Lachnospiraceae bacterium]|nr:class B sortase [Lachnospiraceae bacterium]